MKCSFIAGTRGLSFRKLTDIQGFGTMKYYLKKCRHQELGSVGADGRPHRGRYLLTSKNKVVLSFFPPLSTAQFNDSALLPIIPLYSGEKIYCNYVYHNDKFHGSTAGSPRDEYRIYLNKALEGHQILFRVGDIIVFRKEEITLDDEQQTVYLMDLIQERASAEYLMLDRIISDYPIIGGYGIYEGTLEFFENRAGNLRQLNEAPVRIDDTVTRRVKKENNNAIANLFNAASFRDFVMAGYDNLCAITGTVIRYGDYMNLEAAHIKPRSHGGLYLPSNGLALGRDLHWAFDKGFFTFNDNLEVVVHPRAASDYLHSLAGRRIRIPGNPFFVPDVNNIRYHRENVFGLFLTAGRL